jgi:hypothetical protein
LGFRVLLDVLNIGAAIGTFTGFTRGPFNVRANIVNFIKVTTGTVDWLNPIIPCHDGLLARDKATHG